MFWGGRDCLKDEISNLKQLVDAPHIVWLKDFFIEFKSCFMVLELLTGRELFERVIKQTLFTEQEARESCRCVLMALDHMHGKRIVHQDLKLENLMLTVSAGIVIVCKLFDTWTLRSHHGFSCHLLQHSMQRLPI
jgi:serine/threonine protein kinase